MPILDNGVKIQYVDFYSTSTICSLFNWKSRLPVLLYFCPERKKASPQAYLPRSRKRALASQNRNCFLFTAVVPAISLCLNSNPRFEIREDKKETNLRKSKYSPYFFGLRKIKTRNYRWIKSLRPWLDSPIASFDWFLIYFSHGI